jgi:phosphomannomutase
MKFGTSGLRGLVSDMTDAVCASYSAAFLHHLEASGASCSDVIVGQDRRPSSARIAAACFAGIRSAGARPIDCGIVPTPALALEAAHRRAPAIMITGSHIPFDRNGLKFYRADGEITKADEAGILAALGQPALLPPAINPVERDTGVGARYWARYAAFFGADCLAGKRIGLYQHSAAGRDMMSDGFRSLGADVVDLGRIDGFVPIDTEAVAAEDAARARQWVETYGLDALVSTDGDGDRPLIADETGAILRGDVIGILTAHALGADAVATPLNANTALERSGWFPRIRRTRIGSPYVIAAVEQLRAAGASLAVGFEANGGFLLGGQARAGGRVLPELLTRDAILPMLALLTAAARYGRPLSALAAELPPRTTASDRLQEVSPERCHALLAALVDDPSARADLLPLADQGGVTAVDTLDGVRITLGNGRIVHLRMSGNAPELRCYCEAETPEAAGALMSSLLAGVADRAYAAPQKA